VGGSAPSRDRSVELISSSLNAFADPAIPHPSRLESRRERDQHRRHRPTGRSELDRGPESQHCLETSSLRRAELPFALRRPEMIDGVIVACPRFVLASWCRWSACVLRPVCACSSSQASSERSSESCYGDFRGARRRESPSLISYASTRGGQIGLSRTPIWSTDSGRQIREASGPFEF
jgi:hypothetical protein